MFHYLFGTLFLLATVFCFNQEYCMKGALNAYYGLYKGVVESAVISYSAGAKEIGPYFSKDLVKLTVDQYLEDNLKKYCRSYQVDYYYKDYVRRLPKALKIEITAQISDISTMHRVAVFVIQEQNHESV